jgi:hypothetical protein
MRLFGAHKFLARRSIIIIDLLSRAIGQIRVIYQLVMIFAGVGFNGAICRL